MDFKLSDLLRDIQQTFPPWYLWDRVSPPQEQLVLLLKIMAFNQNVFNPKTYKIIEKHSK